MKIFNLKKPVYWDCPVSVLLSSSGGSQCAHGLISREANPSAQTGRLCSEQLQSVIPETRGDLSFKFSEKREGINYLYQLSASHVTFFLKTYLYCRRYHRITESQNFLGWKIPVRSSSPAINPAESINILINRFELANIWPYDYAAALPEGRIKIQNMKQLDGHLHNDVKSTELKWIPLFASPGLFLVLAQ